VLAEKQRLYPTGAWLCERDGAACGYFLTHPWHADSIPPLDTLLGAIPEDAGTYYLHDLALLPEARGAGAAREAVATALRHATAEGFGTASLVAVNGSQRFWALQGFAVADVPHLSDELRDYEPGARYMRRAL
jgi:GNAT superfamily N-acetyltransferase